MPRANPQLTPLQARKQLLLLEAEVHRAQFCADAARLNLVVRDLTHRATSMGSAVSMAALLAGGLSSFRRGGADGKKPRLITRLLSMAKFAFTAWIALKGRQD